MSETAGPGSRLRLFGRRLLVGAGVVALYRWPFDVELALIASGALVLALPREERLPVWSERVLWIALLLLLLGRARSPVALDLARGRGPAVAFGYVFFLAVETFLVAVAALATRRRPGKGALAVAIVVGVLAARDGAIRVKKRDHPNHGEDGTQDIVNGGAAPLTALGPGLLAANNDSRPDFRGLGFSPRKQPGTFRVVLLGGSTAWGHAQPGRDSSPPGQIEARLATALAPRAVELLCLACPGFTSDHELALIVAGALGWDVDLLLALDGYNDIGYLARRETYPGDMYLWPPHRVGLDHPFRRFALRHGPLPRDLLVRGLTFPHWDAGTLDPGSANGFFLDGAVANEEALAILAADAGVPFGWSAVPLSFDRAIPGADLPHVRQGARGEEMRRRSRDLRERATKAVLSRGGRHLDLPARFARRSTSAPSEAWFVDECHYTDRGVVVLAEEVTQALVESGLVPR